MKLRLPLGRYSLNVYAIITHPDTGYYWNAVDAAFEELNTANWSEYAVALAEDGGAGATGVYTASLPAGITAGMYHVEARRRTGSTPSPTADTEVLGTEDHGDPLAAAAPGSYAAGTVGYQIGRLGAGTVGVAAPVTSSGVVTIVAGDDYLLADGRQIDFDAPSSNFWPNLTGAAVTWNISDGALVVSGTVVTPTGNQRVRFQPVGTQTDDLTRGNYPYSVKAVLSGGSVVTLVLGLAVWRDSEAN